MELSKPASGTAAASPQFAQPARPMSGQGGLSRPSAAYLPEASPASRVSLRPPLQVMIVQAASPDIFGSQPSLSAMGKEMAASLKVQTLNPVPSKCSVQKESFESVRAKFRETLAAALCLDSDHLSGQKSASGVSPVGSASENKHEDDIIVGPSQSASKLNSERDLNADIDVGATVSLNEPESKRRKTSDVVTGEKKGVIQNVQIIPFRIEEELFKLFGGVNKKYKEKGRSLLFNLKDKSNPVLRERVLSGDITPEFLCSMTTEELASKELSAWRLAKAEELAKMVVLPNSEVNVRRLVKKTHKGEFHVEVEESDGIPVEVDLGGNSLSHISKSIEVQTKSDNTANLHSGEKESDNSMRDVVGVKGNSNLQSNLKKCQAYEKDDPVQECMVDDFKDTENLPGIMSFDRLTYALDSELHYEDHSSETAEDAFPNNADITLKQGKACTTEDKAALSGFEFKCDAPSPQDKCRSKTESSKKNVSIPSLCQAKPNGDRLIKDFPKTMVAEKLYIGGESSIAGGTMQSNATPDATLTHGSLWQGTIQFTLSSLTDVVAIFKSGEKPPTKEWHPLIEIKGRVKLSVFKEYLEQLPNSMRRTVTVAELRWKEDSLESGRQHLLQTIDSYIADERVGLVKPTEGVELYLCPSHGKAAQILAENLPKEHFGSLTVTGEASVIGVVVWRRPHGSTRIPHRHHGSSCLSLPLSRKRQAVIASSVPMLSQLTKTPSSHFIHYNEHCRLSGNDDASGAVPLGFSQCGVKHDDDVPEYNFVSVSNTSADVATSHTSRSQQHAPTISRPRDQVKQLVDKYGKRNVPSQPRDDNEDQVRQLVHKYGNRNVSSEPLDDNDDDLLSRDQVRQLVHTYGDRYVSAQPWDGNVDDLWSSDQVRQLVHKYGNMYVPAQPGDGNDDDLRPSDQVRQLVQKYGNRYNPDQPWDRNNDDFWPLDQVSHLVHKYHNKYVSAQPWDGNNDDLPPPGQVRQMVCRYGDMYPAHSWDGRGDELPELYWDPIQSRHQRTWYPHPLMSPTGHDQQRDHYYHHRHHLQEHYDRMPLEVYIGPEQHVMAAQQRWNYESVMHPAETLGWRSNTHRDLAGMPGEAVMPMQDFVRQPYFGMEPDMWWRPYPRRCWE